MTSPKAQTDNPEEEIVEVPEPLLFNISFARLAELKRSAIMLVAARRVPTCPSLDLPDIELTDPQMTIQEILFRTLLSRRNAPTLLSDLHYELTERWSTPVRPINLTEGGLRIVLQSDNYYGFATVDK